MPYVRYSGIKGLIYVPEGTPENLKKHDCKDCFSCRMCSDSRCGLCRKEQSSGRKNLQKGNTDKGRLKVDPVSID